jgi:hypothetical protein
MIKDILSRVGLHMSDEEYIRYDKGFFVSDGVSTADLGWSLGLGLDC